MSFLKFSCCVVVTVLSSTVFAAYENEAIRAACASKLPVLVYDNFSSEMGLKPVIDVNGDLIPELSHGEYVAKVAELFGKPVVPLNMVGDVELPSIESALSEVIQSIESGASKYSRINFSQELPLKISAFKADLFSETEAVPEITRENIADYRDVILKKLWTERPDFRLEELNALFLRFQKAGVPIVVAAGNFGPSYVNLFSLFPGVVSVGSLDLDGTKRLLSADNALVTVWRTGSFVSQQLNDGVDINGDGVVDFSKDRLSQGKKVVEMYAGQPVNTTVSLIPQDFIEWTQQISSSKYVVANAALNVISEGLYLVSDLVSLATVTSGTANHFTKSGKYAYKSPNGPPTFFMGDDGAGTLVFDPLKNGASNQVAMVSGTSFAAPSLCNQD